MGRASLVWQVAAGGLPTPRKPLTAHLPGTAVWHAHASWACVLTLTLSQHSMPTRRGHATRGRRHGSAAFVFSASPPRPLRSAALRVHRVFRVYEAPRLRFGLCGAGAIEITDPHPPCESDAGTGRRRAPSPLRCRLLSDGFLLSWNMADLRLWQEDAVGEELGQCGAVGVV